MATIDVEMNNKMASLRIEDFPPSVAPLMAPFDRDGDGEIDASEIAYAGQLYKDARDSAKRFKKLAIAAVVVATFLLCAIFGLVFAVVKLTKDTGVKGGFLTDTKGNAIRVAATQATTATPVSSEMDNEAFLNLKYITMSGPVLPGSGGKAASVTLSIQGVARTPATNSTTGSIVSVYTPMGTIYLDGTKMSTDSTDIRKALGLLPRSDSTPVALPVQLAWFMQGASQKLELVAAAASQSRRRRRLQETKDDVKPTTTTEEESKPVDGIPEVPKTIEDAVTADGEFKAANDYVAKDAVTGTPKLVDLCAAKWAQTGTLAMSTYNYRRLMTGRRLQKEDPSTTTSGDDKTTTDTTTDAPKEEKKVYAPPEPEVYSPPFIKSEVETTITSLIYLTPASDDAVAYEMCGKIATYLNQLYAIEIYTQYFCAANPTNEACYVPLPADPKAEVTEPEPSKDTPSVGTDEESTKKIEETKADEGAQYWMDLKAAAEAQAEEAKRRRA